MEDLDMTWGEKLEKLLNTRRDGWTYEVVNTGVRGYNSFQLLVLHSMYLKNLEYDLLVLYLNANDMTANGEYGPFTYRELFEAKTGGRWNEVEKVMGVGRSSDGATLTARLQNRLDDSTLYRGLTRAIVNWRGKRVFGQGEFKFKRANPIEDYIKNLEGFHDLAEERNAQALFTSEFIYTVIHANKELELEHTMEFINAMRETAARLGVPFCDTYQMLNEYPDPAELVFPWDIVHFNETGTDVLSRKMVECLETNGLLPPRAH
ncbi:MAG: GDSL-type esterase/lipase family protein [Deltaproteobacteria bacterium]|nr:GDSL-type esterase/lipase family protein [Deltaproteobacteria bacterium]